jgi:ribosomal-protein-alanine N-acetyltransferase
MSGAADLCLHRWILACGYNGVIPANQPTCMHYHLISITPEDLHTLAASALPDMHGHSCAIDALPPHFVAARALEQMAAGVPAYWCSTFYVIATTEKHIVGSCGFKHAPIDGMVEIGYGISPDCRKQGAATAAVQALLQLAFEGGARQVMAQVNPENLASTRVVQKLGFINTGSYVDAAQETLVRWKFKRPD